MSSDGGSVLMDPSIVYFTFSRIRPKFSCGRTVADTIASIQSGELDAASLPRITVLYDGRHYYSLNNRRLFVFKALKDLGIVASIPVRLKAVPQTKRMVGKYTPAKCSLTATVMREGDRDITAARSDDGDDGVSEDDDVIASHRQVAKGSGAGGGDEVSRLASSCSTNGGGTAAQERPGQLLGNNDGVQSVPSSQGEHRSNQKAAAVVTAPRKKGINDLADDLASLSIGVNDGGGSSDDEKTHPTKKGGRKRAHKKRDT